MVADSDVMSSQLYVIFNRASFPEQLKGLPSIQHLYMQCPALMRCILLNSSKVVVTGTTLCISYFLVSRPVSRVNIKWCSGPLSFCFSFMSPSYLITSLYSAVSILFLSSRPKQTSYVIYTVFTIIFI